MCRVRVGRRHHDLIKRSRKDPDDDRDDTLEQKDYWGGQISVSVRADTQAQSDPHSHDRTEPIESILRIPDANNPPNAPARGEQTKHRSEQFSLMYRLEYTEGLRLTQVHGQSEGEFSLGIPSGQVIGDSRQHSCFGGAQEESYGTPGTEISDECHADREYPKHDGVKWDRSSGSEPAS